MKTKYPAGWNERKVRRVLKHYDSQTEDEAIAEDEELLDDYGARELAAAVAESLERDTPRAASVAFVLARRHRSARRTLLPVDLSRHPELPIFPYQPINWRYTMISPTTTLKTDPQRGT